MQEQLKMKSYRTASIIEDVEEVQEAKRTSVKGATRQRTNREPTQLCFLTRCLFQRPRPPKCICKNAHTGGGIVSAVGELAVLPNDQRLVPRACVIQVPKQPVTLAPGDPMSSLASAETPTYIHRHTDMQTHTLTYTFA